LKKIVFWIINLYQETVSPLLGSRCRFWPRCSQYTIEAVEMHGTAVGLCLGLLRIMRCNTLFRGGFDPVPELKSYRMRKRAQGMREAYRIER
jgi:putative membrane protein insertion efficiency factor